MKKIIFAMMVVLLSSCAVDQNIDRIIPADDSDVARLVSYIHGDVSGMRQCLYVDNVVVILPSKDGEDTIIVKSYDPVSTVFFTALLTVIGCTAFYLIVFAREKEK